MIDSQRDFLESQRLGDSVGEFPPLTEQNTLLRAILRELQKTHPNQRCVVDLQFNRADQLLTGPDDRCRVSFLNQGLPVLAQYIVVSTNLDLTVAVGINEPVTSLTATSSTGILLFGGEKLQLPLEIQFIELALVDAGPIAVAVNNSAAIAANGRIQVYGWTIPSAGQF